MSQRFGDYEFTFVCQIEPQRNENGEIEVDLPQERYRKRHLARLHAYGTGAFCRFRVPSDWPHRGVYVITVDGVPHYVGKCEHLSKRYNMGYGQISPRNCYEGGQRTNCRINKLILAEAQRDRTVELWFYQTDAHSEIEAPLIQQLATRNLWNRSG
jgi:hypothetical protein